MTNKGFKVGDRVECLDLCIAEGGENVLEVGKIYTIESIRDGGYICFGKQTREPNYMWMHDNFELACIEQDNEFIKVIKDRVRLLEI